MKRQVFISNFQSHEDILKYSIYFRLQRSIDSSISSATSIEDVLSSHAILSHPAQSLYSLTYYIII